MTNKADTRRGVIRKLHIMGSDGYPEGLTCYASLIRRDDGAPIGLMLTCNKLGSLEHVLLAALGETATVALELGVPLSRLSKGWKGMQGEPSGMTGQKDIPMVKSIIDFLGRWLEAQDASAPLEGRLDGGTESHP